MFLRIYFALSAHVAARLQGYGSFAILGECNIWMPGGGKSLAKLEHYIQVGVKCLRCGYTTGTCAAAAAGAAVELLLAGEVTEEVQVRTPSGVVVRLEPEMPRTGSDWASCAIRKDAGDDPDVTDGIYVYARAERDLTGEIIIEGGQGVGRVTKPGLNQPVGAYAINTVPREMIISQVKKSAEKYGASGGFKITISMPEGEEIAKKTFNPRLGIQGGISVLGTSGIVRPMSEAAIIDSMKLEMDVLFADGERNILVTPGNYGEAFSRDYLGLISRGRISCSNYVGECIDHAVYLGVESLLLVGHIGKLIKVAAGNMNTHSRVSDGRRETLAAHAALCGGNMELVGEVFRCVTTEAAIELLTKADMRDSVMTSIITALEETLKLRAGGMRVESVMFSPGYGVLEKTSGADELLALFQEKEKQG